MYKEHSRHPWQWEKIPGHERNEPLDCRNYALAAFTALAPDMDAILRRMNKNMGEPREKPAGALPQRKAPVKTAEQRMDEFFDW